MSAPAVEAEPATQAARLLLGEPSGSQLSLEEALLRISAAAPLLDASPRFPHECFDALKAASVPQLAADRGRCGLAAEIALVRAVAAADASTARILDGHFNAAERLANAGEAELAERELGGVAAGQLLLGVWGADPGPGEGPPAHLARTAAGEPVLRGVKTFCSGAGGVQRALVVARDEQGARRLLYLDVTRAIDLDRSWYHASGLKASESHRVEFRDTPVLAVLGGADELAREPWFSRDATRSAATWAGIADRILAETVSATAGVELDGVRLHALGRMRVALGSIDRWLDHATAVLSVLDSPEAAASAGASERRQARSLSIETRAALSDAARLIAASAGRICGSRALVSASALDRARRDLDLFLLQHRLDGKLVELGALAREQAPTLAPLGGKPPVDADGAGAPVDVRDGQPG